jgi:hypothetical protein
MRRLLLSAVFLGATMVAAGAQTGPIAVHLDLVADGSIRSQMFSCIRRGITGASDLSFVEENDAAKTHTVSVRAMPSVAGRRTIGYAASIVVTRHMSPALRERLTQQLQGEEKTRTLAELRRYGATELARIAIRPPNINKFCDYVSAEIETGLFDTSGRGREPASSSGR